MAGKYRDDSHIPTVSSSGRLYRYLYCFWEVLCFENRAFCDSLISLLFFSFFFFFPLPLDARIGLSNSRYKRVLNLSGT
ncbi:hypothetical protein NC651_038065 [Populus alba x Populus x berolinensis]|nr:hypothetical protein NC651_038065 [Populus alba x Populus x berolinensis]